MLGRDRLDLIELLDRISETGSLSRGARAVGLSQPSASRLLKSLEEMLGVMLVQRNTHGLCLTPAGVRFLAAGRGLLAGWDKAIDEVRTERDDLRGHLRIVAPIAAGQTLLASIVARFVRDNPGVTIEWTLNDELIDFTAEGCDLWIRAGELPADNLVVRDLWQIERAIVAAPTHPLVEHPSELAGSTAVRTRTFVPEAVELTRRDGERHLLRQSSAFLVDNLFAARAVLLEGLGYGILPLWAVQRDFARGALVRLCSAWSPPVVKLSLAYPPDRSRPRRLAALLDFIKAELLGAGGMGIAFLEERDARDSVCSGPAASLNKAV